MGRGVAVGLGIAASPFRLKLNCLGGKTQWKFVMGAVYE